MMDDNNAIGAIDLDNNVILDGMGMEFIEEHENESPFQNTRRRKASNVWSEFTRVVLPDGTQKGECIHCGTLLSFSGSTTTHFSQHLTSCVKRILSDQLPTPIQNACTRPITSDNDAIGAVNVDKNISVEATENEFVEEHEEENPFQNKGRRKKSSVWAEFKVVVLPDGTKKGECIHCKALLSLKAGTTTHFSRHLTKTCLKRRRPGQLLTPIQYVSTRPITNDNDAIVAVNLDENVTVEATENMFVEEHEGDNPFQNKKRSRVWSEFRMVVLPDGTKKGECIHCKALLSHSGGTTTHFSRHLTKTCLKRKLSEQLSTPIQNARTRPIISDNDAIGKVNAGKNISVEATENEFDEEHEEENPFGNKKRRKTSSVWSEFKVVVLPDGTKKGKCIHCKALLSLKAGTTTHFSRHLRNACLKRRLPGQPLISMQLSCTRPFMNDNDAIGAINLDENETVEATENEVIEEHEEENPFHNKERRKTSTLWSGFKEVVLPDGTKKAERIHSKSLTAGTTTHISRHLTNACFKRKLPEQLLTSSSGDPYTYDHVKMRESVASFILMHEHAFTTVEQEGFNLMIQTATPLYQRISQTTVKDDCLALYEREKKKLKLLLKNVSRISLATDLWKSDSQKIKYMVITGCFVDANWKLQKRILNFVDVPPLPGGVEIADAIYKCLTEWEIENKVFTVSVDNATYNDEAIRTLKENFAVNKKVFFGGKLFHVRCCAHTLNNMALDGLRVLGHIIENVRESVKFINQSDARLLNFSEIVQQLQLPERQLIIDCPTRWISTYDMLTAALKFEAVFLRFKERDPHYINFPSPGDWEKVKNVCEILQPIRIASKIISGSEYPTSNLFFSELYRIKEILNEKSVDENDYIQEMAKQMKLKFDKYWGSCNLLISLASILDPRCKMRLVEFCFPLIYPEAEAQRNIVKVREALYELFEEYATLQGSTTGSTTSSGYQGNMSSSEKASGWSSYEDYVSMMESIQPEKTDLDRYLEHKVYRCADKSSFDALEWWKENNMKYPTLSRLACDMLAIPVTTVASESAFSAGGRVIDAYQASLCTDTIQVLLCGGDWVRQLHGVKKSSKEDNRITEIILPI